MAIKGVPAPEKIQYKVATEEDAKPEAEGNRVVDKIVEAASEAAEAAKTMAADTDGEQHEEL